MLREYDSCGVGFVCDLKNKPSYNILEMGLVGVKNLTHRGAVSADGKSGDGCGILFEIPTAFFSEFLRSQGRELAASEHIACGVFFLPENFELERLKEVFKTLEIPQEFYVREVPINREVLGDFALETLPRIIQVLIPFSLSPEDMEFKLFFASQMIEKSFPHVHVASFSAFNVVYKGMLIAPNLDMFYPDLKNTQFETRYAIFHQRYSTNTAPRWQLAQPFNAIAHNGEINTILANRRNFKFIERSLAFLEKKMTLEEISPLLMDEESDSASLDKVFRLLLFAGYSPELAINLLIPPAWEGLPFVSSKLRAFFQFNEMIMEPWDGPAAVVFCDGTTIGAHLDRNGLRPLRYTVYEDGILVVGSETGIVSRDVLTLKRGKLGSGDTLAVKIATGRIKTRMEILNELSLLKDFEDIAKKETYYIGKKEGEEGPVQDITEIYPILTAFAYTEEDVKEIIPAAAKTGAELTFSMGDDTPLPTLANNPPLLFRYFKQRFAQVTNPPIDPIREKGLTSLTVYLGGKKNILNYHEREHASKIVLPSPVLTEGELNEIKEQNKWPHCTISTVYEKEVSLKDAIYSLQNKVLECYRNKNKIFILSDRDYSSGKRYIPSLLALVASCKILESVGALREADIIIETGEVRNSHQLATLISFGGAAVFPWLAYKVAMGIDIKGIENMRRTLEEGLRKIMSKMGISCVASYRNGCHFDVLCLDNNFLSEFFPDAVVSDIEGHGVEDIEKNYAYYEEKGSHFTSLPIGGDLRFKKDGEWHSWSPYLLKNLNKFLKDKDYASYRSYADVADNFRPSLIRHFFDLPSNKSLPIEEVEREEDIVKKFFTGGMSLGALSPEAHEVIIEACNRLGMKCNSGEGGEDPKRYNTEKGSSIKQVASGRFGVTPDYLASAKEIEIKLAQGAKPGEGGQLPGHKVSTYIAYLRHSQAGLTLISPPPHHDIYSIEDLAQLINDLKHANPYARIGVKLVSEKGIGQIASGAVKAYADFIQISSVEGGTGASPYVSIKNAGNYWEFGLSETHLTLVDNGLRDRVLLRVDGGLRTGKDVIIAAFLGAEEFGFGTAAMLAEGCIMARQCHKNTCPTGIATQDPELRKRFRGKVEDVIAFFMAIARDVREHLARMGYRSLKDIVGKAYQLKIKEYKDFSIDKRSLRLFLDRYEERHHCYCKIYRNEPSGDELNKSICEDVRPFLEKRQPFVKTYIIKNTDRSVPVRLNYYIAKQCNGNFLPEDSIKLLFEGVAGQSFGAFNHRGLTLELIGEGNDYVGKGMFGGRIVIKPKPSENLKTYKNYLVGNTCLYGATGGEVFIAGMVGERFGVRNSGAMAVIEGAGHHLCEYMTGGVIVCLGNVGLNVGAGMTGGLAFIYDEADNLEKRINKDYVIIKPLDGMDKNLLQMMLNKHYYYTQSLRAKEILLDFDNSLQKMKKIFPKELQKFTNVSKGETM